MRLRPSSREREQSSGRDSPPSGLTGAPRRTGFLRREWTEPNSLLLIRADAALHRVLPVKRGERSILKARRLEDLASSRPSLVLRSLLRFSRMLQLTVRMPARPSSTQIVYTPTSERLPSFITHLATTYL